MSIAYSTVQHVPYGNYDNVMVAYRYRTVHAGTQSHTHWTGTEHYLRFVLFVRR